MIKNKLYNIPSLITLNNSFIEAQPYSYICIDNFLDEGLARSLSKNFPTLSQMDIQYKGLNEQKAEHSTFEHLHEDFLKLKSELFQENFIQQIEAISGIRNLQVIDDRYGSGLHQGGKGSFLDVHIDYNLHPTEKKQRRLNLILFLNEHWEKKWGGSLELWNENASECITQIEPKFNRCVLFLCNEKSFHGYSLVNCPSAITRKSFYLYFFTQPEKRLFFHDTIFKPTITDHSSKKFRVLLKEFLKNNIKRIIYYTGLNKFLK